MFSAKFDKLDEDNQVSDEIELTINLNNNKNLTESIIDDNNVRSQLEQHISNQETKDSDCRFDESNSRTKFFYKTSELN